MKDKLNQPIFINITLTTVFKVFFGLFLIYSLYVLRDLVLVLITSVVIASAIEPIVKFFVSRRIPRTLSVVFIYFALISLFAAIFITFAGPLVFEIKNVINSLPQYLISVTESNDLSTFPAWNNFILGLKDIESSQIFSAINGGANSTTAGLISTAGSIFGGIFSLILIIVLSFYFSVQENGVENFIRIITPIKSEKYILDLWKRSQRKIGLWMQGQLLLALIIGVLIYLGLTILGIKNALLLSIIAAIFELIPIFGPILASVPAIIFGFINGGLTLALLVAGLYAIVQQFESQLIHPLVVKKIVGIPALIAILSLIIGAEIAGFLGILIAVPITGAIMEYINDLSKKKMAEMEKMEV